MDINVTNAIKNAQLKPLSNVTCTDIIAKEHLPTSVIFCQLILNLMKANEINLDRKEAVYNILYLKEALKILDLKDAIKDMMYKESDGSWTCSECNSNTRYHTTLTNHVEAKHLSCRRLLLQTLQ